MALIHDNVSIESIVRTVFVEQNLRMKTTHRLVLAALLSTTAACSANAADEPAASSDQSIVAAPTFRGTEMFVSYEARVELRDALGQTPKDEFDFGEVSVPSVIRVQHQYSVAAVRLEAASWSLVTGLPVDDSHWGMHSSLGVMFPRWAALPSEPDFNASQAAAEKLFNALVAATETHEEVAAGVVETTRASAKKTFSCTKTTSPSRPTKFQCTIAGVTSVGGAGLLWDSQAPADENR
jgi:hypothetical protein